MVMIRVLPTVLIFPDWVIVVVSIAFFKEIQIGTGNV